jgi:hypothetical protein
MHEHAADRDPDTNPPGPKDQQRPAGPAGALAEAVSMRAVDPLKALKAPGPVAADVATETLAALASMDALARRDTLQELRACGAVERLLQALPQAAQSGPHRPVVDELIALVRRPGPPEAKAKPVADHEAGPGPHERHREGRSPRPRRG